MFVSKNSLQFAVRSSCHMQFNQCECHMPCHVEFHFIFIAFPVPEYADDIIPSQKSCEAKLVKKLHVD